MSWERMNQIRETGVMRRRMIEFFVDDVMEGASVHLSRIQQRPMRSSSEEPQGEVRSHLSMCRDA